MRPLWAAMIVVTACGSAAAPSPSPELTLAARPTATPAPSPTRTSVPTPTPAPTPSPSISIVATPTGSPTPLVVPTVAGGPRGAQPPGSLHYVAIGASDTAGVGAVDPSTGSWPSRIAELLPPASTYRNLGVPGSLTAQAKLEQVPAAVREQPTLVTIWLAVNDLNAQVSVRDHSVALGAIVDALASGTSARIFVGNVPDLRAVPAYAGGDQAALLATVQAYNAGIAAAAARHADRVTVVDLFTGSATLTTQITVSTDGFHPSDAGYELIAQRFVEAMRRAGVPLRGS